MKTEELSQKVFESRQFFRTLMENRPDDLQKLKIIELLALELENPKSMRAIAKLARACADALVKRIENDD